jgi:sugar phosphate permease
MASYAAAPIAGLFAAWMAWMPAFNTSSIILLVMGVMFFVSFTVFEKKGMVQPNRYAPKKEAGGNVKVLLKRQILKWTVISMLTGIVRTAVLFWLPTYISQHLSFDAESAALLYAVGTSVIAINSVLAVVILDWLKQDLNKAILLFFSVSAACFLGVFLVQQPHVNLALLVLAMIFSNCASSLMWSRYCPSLIDTGMVSSATGYLDFCSYMAAAISSKLFAGAVGAIGWSNLILVWFGLMGIGVVISLPFRKKATVN